MDTKLSAENHAEGGNENRTLFTTVQNQGTGAEWALTLPTREPKYTTPSPTV